MLRMVAYLGLCSLLTVAGFAYLVRSGLDTWDQERAYSGRLEDQRQLAECYFRGCLHVVKSELLACAWREVIADETKSRTDVAAAQDACRDLPRENRRLLSPVEEDLRARLHLGSKAHG